jgi:hypothetical protein
MVELNKHAFDEAVEAAHPVHAFNGRALACPFKDHQFDLSVSCGFLIHVPDTELYAHFDLMDRLSCEYVLMCEYYSKRPREVFYRGHDGLLWARDYGGLFLEAHPEYTLLANGFLGRPKWGAGGFDDMTYWLMVKA